MEYTSLGRSGLKVSRLCLGTMNFGPRPEEEEYSSFCNELGEKESNVALAWLLANPTVAAPIIGPRTLEQSQGVLRSVEIELERDSLARPDVIFPGSGGEAPEAYAPEGGFLRRRQFQEDVTKD